MRGRPSTVDQIIEMACFVKIYTCLYSVFGICYGLVAVRDKVFGAKNRQLISTSHWSLYQSEQQSKVNRRKL
jgi:hypothetical protein